MVYYYDIFAHRVAAVRNVLNNCIFKINILPSILG